MPARAGTVMPADCGTPVSHQPATHVQRSRTGNRRYVSRSHPIHPLSSVSKDHDRIDNKNDLFGDGAGHAARATPRRVEETASRYGHGLAPHEKEDPIM